jgi:hypothetical protein
VFAANPELLLTPVKLDFKIALFPTISMNYKDMSGGPL